MTDNPSSIDETYDNFQMFPNVQAAVEALPEYQALLAQCRADGYGRMFPVLQRLTQTEVINIGVRIEAG